MGKTKNGKRLRDSQWKWGVTWLKRRVKLFPAKNEQTSVKMSVKLHSEMSGEILGSVGISQWMLFCRWNRAISLSTFLIKCRHFQRALLCTILQGTSPVCLPQICSCRAPGQPSCLDCVREGNPAASRILSTNVGTRSPRGCWLLTRVCRCPAATDGASARYGHSPGSPAPVVTSTALVWALQISKNNF